MVKLKLTGIQRFDKDKEGNPLKTKDGRPYTRLVIKTADGKSLSGFDSIQTQNWREGDEVEVEVEQKGEYLNFKLPNKQDGISRGLEVIQNQLTKILMLLQDVHKNTQPAGKYEDPDVQAEAVSLRKHYEEEPPF